MRRRHRSFHFRAWVVLAVVLPLGFALGLILRQDPPVDPTRFDVQAPPGD